MKEHAATFPIDSSAILFLAQVRPDHTNVFRFTAAMSEDIDPELLQQAADRIYLRFPTIFAGFQPDKYSYRVVPSAQAPQVRQDPGLLRVMSLEEMGSCAYRLFYSGSQVIIEAFHALTDGYGAIVSLKALLSEYIYLRYGVSSPEREALQTEQPVLVEEVQDAYQEHSGAKSGAVQQRYSYQMTIQGLSDQVRASTRQIHTQALRRAAKRNGISVTSMLSELMAEAIMEFQHRCAGDSRKRPVRIMVPVDLRRQFPSKTLRNFILYALPTLTSEEMRLSRRERFHRFQEQLRKQTDKMVLRSQITRNVKIQQSFLFRMLPLGWKCALMRISNRFFGETNSSITLTNLGPVALSDELKAHVSWIQVHLMPRRSSPYNCALLTCGDVTSITITRLGMIDELEDLFFEKLHDELKN